MFRLRLVRFNSTKTEEKLRQIIESSNLKQPKSITTPPFVPRKSSNESSINKKNDKEEPFEKFKLDLKSKIDNLPSQQEAVRSKIRKNLSNYMESFQTAIFNATRTLNDVTGYSSIEKLRADVEILEDKLKVIKNELTVAKQQYNNAIQVRSTSQKDINELLTRKHNWNSSDLEKFTELYRNDHKNEQHEATCQQEVDRLETEVDSIQLKLTQSILTRYHEEQIWSDKIRRASTWGTWLLMGFNILLFFTATFIVEPWKRSRMVDSFEDKVKLAILEMTNEQSGKMDKIITNQTISSSESTLAAEHEYSVYLPFHNWLSFKRGLLNNIHAILNPSVTDLKFNKYELGWFLSFVSLFTGLLASMITICFI